VGGGLARRLLRTVDHTGEPECADREHRRHNRIAASPLPKGERHRAVDERRPMPEFSARIGSTPFYRATVL
jgi:hypothetical protein